MKSIIRVGILAGGLGTRLSEETDSKPKPMVAIGENPILWHLMSIFSAQDCNDFAIALGYKGDVIKRWLLDLHQLSGNLYIEGESKVFTKKNDFVSKEWNVHAIETGLSTQTGGRVRHLLSAFPKERLLVTYGDGLANVNITKLVNFHLKHGKLATLTTVRPPARFGHLEFKDGLVTRFGEKQQLDVGWINGGFFVLEPEVINYIDNDLEPFESGALSRLVADGQLMAFEHQGFWQPMDTLREKNELSRMAQMPVPPWMNLESDTHTL